MSVDKQDLIEHEEEQSRHDPASPRYSAYDGPATISVDNIRVSVHDKRSSYTAYPQPTPFDDTSPDGLTTSSVPYSSIADPFSLHTDNEADNQNDQTDNKFASLLEPPPDYTTYAILVAIFCCVPFGVYGFMKAKEARAFHDAGHNAAAVEASKKALRSVKIGVLLGCTIVLTVIITTVVLLFVLGLL